ncbi:MAG: fibro-slime domain-containing protein [Candidatus Fibromonas sp.]|jgi:fibro-slime domain-containing protein|nr:fibro-slime domain-containing protein [Candidatus Fibromonas sp.]
MRGSLRKLALTFSVLALLAVNAAAQCGGKKVYIQLPSSGWSKTTISILWEGTVRTTTAQVQGDFSVFTFPTGWPNDGATKTFAFSMKSTDIDNGNQWIASGNRFNITGSRPSDAQQFSCNIFGSKTELYIYPDPANPSTTRTSTDPPNAYYFYFLPPSDPEWTLGKPQIAHNDNGQVKKIKFDIDANHCGWYKHVFFNEPVPSGVTLIWLNDLPNDQVGIKGLDEDPLDWVDGMPEPFSLLEQFETRGSASPMRELYFVPADGASGWYSTYPNKEGVCSYGFAAIIYDTDKSVNNSFFQDCNTGHPDYAPEFGACTNDNPATPGIVKGIPKNELAPVDGIPKMQWANKSGNVDGWTEPNFTAAFKSTPGKNVVRCYDMPFKRNSAGLWEFNSNKLCKNNTMDLAGDCGGGNRGNPGYMGGFYPPELQTRGTADYSGCPTCDKTWHTQGWVPLTKTGTTAVSQFCYDRGRRSGTSEDNLASCGPEFGAGDLRDGDNPTIWEWDGQVWPRLDSWTPQPNNTVAMPKKNAHYCFESAPATFIYEPGQEFFFSGDDDIWIYINNKLAIDLGGTHLAAPGYVNLQARANELGLTEGGEYPINIFFCDRRTTMSNVRITTNMYFAQKNSLKVNDVALTPQGAQICIESSGSDGSCTAATSGTGGSSEPKCGTEMGDILDYFLLNRRGERIELNTSNSECKVQSGSLVCYGGITLTNWPRVDRIKVVPSAAYGLVGTQRIYAEIKKSQADNFPNATPVLITSFTVSVGDAVPVWGQIDTDDGKHIYNLGPKEKNVVSGKLVPVGFSAGTWHCEDPNNYGSNSCPFDVAMAPQNEGGAYGKQVRISISADPGATYSGLTFYSDSLGENEVQPNSTFTIPDSGPFQGLLVLWVAGDYMAREDERYTINNDLKVNVFLPRLAFINPENNNRLSRTAGSDPSASNNVIGMGVLIGTRLDRTIGAFDISDGSPGVLCTTCEFKLSINAWAEANGNRFDANSKFGTDRSLISSTPASGSIELINGVAEFAVAGLKRVWLHEDNRSLDTFAYFRVRGPTEKPETFAQWDSLLFELPDTPAPIAAEIYDRDGDGIGDSLRVYYHRRFATDSLPSYLLVTWDPDTTLGFGLGRKDGDTYKGGDIRGGENREYWNRSNGDFEMRLEAGPGQLSGYSDSIIVIYGKSSGEDVKINFGFSKDVKTNVGSRGNIEVISWATYKNSRSGETVDGEFRVGIDDKIPPIVVRANYRAGEKCGGTAQSPCEDLVTITLSEPVKANLELPPNGDEKRAPFAYKLWRSFGINEWRYYHGDKNLPPPNRMIWSKSGTTLDENESDSLVRMTYLRYKDVSDTTYTPGAGDSVRFVWEGLGYYALMDLVGNKPNPREIGRQLEGSRPFEIDKMPIAELDPEKDIFKDALKELEDNAWGHGLFEGGRTDTLFNDKRPIVFLPALDNWTAPDSIKLFYPASVGELFKPDIFSKVSEIEVKHDVSIPSESIIFHAKVFYHTNIGNFVVDSKPVTIRCNDPIFRVNGAGDCRNGGAKSIYLAWNLKDSKARWVGAGAYVEVYDFHWEVDYEGPDRSGKRIKVKETVDKAQQKIEMKGVKRVKKGR